MIPLNSLDKRLAVAALVLALGACGGGGGGGGSSTSSAPTNGDTVGGGTGNADATRPSPNAPAQAAVNCSLQYSLTNLPAQGSGTDPRLSAQWHLEAGATGALAAWAGGRRGEGVRVAVVDDAIETVHEDLYPNVVPGASHNYLTNSADPLPCTAADSHGTSVTGIILARDANGLGGAGVAPRAGLVGYNALATAGSADVIDAMTRGLADNAIVHNSWGSPDDGALHPSSALWEQQIQAGLRDGRGGRGTVYVFAAGNGGVISVALANGASRARAGLDNSNFDGYTNKLGIIAACAVDRAGRSPSFAEPGANLLVCGPSSGITTTAIRNAYTAAFSGTSASAPMVSGVAALVLQARPDLTWRDVRLVLARSARETDPSATDWLPSAVAGKRFSHRYGFGAVDAPAAIALAATWPSVGGSSALQSCGPYARSPNRPIPDAGGQATPGAPVVDAVTVTDCAIRQIEFVEVSFTSDHPYGGDLQITLTSPGGLTSELARARDCDANGTIALDPSSNPCRSTYQDWRFGSVRHLDEAVSGRWQLSVSDADPEVTGTLQRWSVRFWGR